MYLLNQVARVQEKEKKMIFWLLIARFSGKFLSTFIGQYNFAFLGRPFIGKTKTPKYFLKKKKKEPLHPQRVAMRWKVGVYMLEASLVLISVFVSMPSKQNTAFLESYQHWSPCQCITFWKLFAAVCSRREHTLFALHWCKVAGAKFDLMFFQTFLSP